MYEQSLSRCAILNYVKIVRYGRLGSFKTVYWLKLKVSPDNFKSFSLINTTKKVVVQLLHIY